MSGIVGLLGIPGMIIAFITLVSFLVMVPSAFATWYSRCLNIKLSYGFLIALSSIILGILLFKLDLPLGVKKNIFLVYNIIMAMIMIYGVYRQFTGRCSLGGGNL